MNPKRKRWDELSPWAKVAVVTAATLDVVLRGWALVDLARRPKDEVKGPKAAWAAALTAVSSGGLVPALYLRWGRRTR